jgi:hypothetical protein
VTAYDFLRILFPGYFAMGNLLVYLALFLPATFLSLLSNSVVFGAVAVSGGVLLGFVLYAIDWPARRQVYKAENAKLNNFIVERAKTCPNGTKIEINEYNATTLYFLILDADVPAQRRDTIFYFGSVYKVYADIRATIVVATGSILITAIGRLLAQTLLYKLQLYQAFESSSMALVTVVTLLVLFAVFRKWNKGDRYYKSIIKGQLLWLQLNPEIIDKLVCK